MKAHLNSLENINALALPAKVLVLLSKYAKALRNHNGTILKLSSLRIFKHIHDTCEKANSPKLNVIYDQLLAEVNNHISAGTMYTNDERQLMRKNQKQNPLRKLAKNIPFPVINKNNTNTRIPTVEF